MKENYSKKTIKMARNEKRSQEKENIAPDLPDLTKRHIEERGAFLTGADISRNSSKIDSFGKNVKHSS